MAKFQYSIVIPVQDNNNNNGNHRFSLYHATFESNVDLLNPKNNLNQGQIKAGNLSRTAAITQLDKKITSSQSASRFIFIETQLDKQRKPSSIYINATEVQLQSVKVISHEQATSDIALKPTLQALNLGLLLNAGRITLGEFQLEINKLQPEIKKEKPSSNDATDIQKTFDDVEYAMNRADQLLHLLLGNVKKRKEASENNSAIMNFQSDGEDEDEGNYDSKNFDQSGVDAAVNALTPQPKSNNGSNSPPTIMSPLLSNIDLRTDYSEEDHGLQDLEQGLIGAIDLLKSLKNQNKKLNLKVTAKRSSINPFPLARDSFENDANRSQMSIDEYEVELPGTEAQKKRKAISSLYDVDFNQLANHGDGLANYKAGKFFAHVNPLVVVVGSGDNKTLHLVRMTWGDYQRFNALLTNPKQLKPGKTFERGKQERVQVWQPADTAGLWRSDTAIRELKPKELHHFEGAVFVKEKSKAIITMFDGRAYAEVAEKEATLVLYSGNQKREFSVWIDPEAETRLVKANSGSGLSFGFLFKLLALVVSGALIYKFAKPYMNDNVSDVILEAEAQYAQDYDNPDRRSYNEYLVADSIEAAFMVGMTCIFAVLVADLFAEAFGETLFPKVVNRLRSSPIGKEVCEFLKDEHAAYIKRVADAPLPDPEQFNVPSVGDGNTSDMSTDGDGYQRASVYTRTPTYSSSSGED